ncbi:MAG: hypothetical protein HKM24_04650 [Gammaproteobacteria bacterium]|nr:hypothetical protein [Gammaproteobacteria bacterium]
MVDSTIIFAVLAIIVSVMRYGTYLWSIYKRETRPHVFSWFNWGLVTAIGTVAQFKLGGGPSAWVLLVVSATCLFIAFVALFIGEKNITRSDWFAFLGALCAIPVWLATDDPLAAIFIIVVIDLLTYWPTIRKSWSDPWGEPPRSYFWAGLRYFLALFAVPDPSFATLIYPFFLMASDWGFAIYNLWRRSVLGKIHRIIDKK